MRLEVLALLARTFTLNVLSARRVYALLARKVSWLIAAPVPNAPHSVTTVHLSLSVKRVVSASPPKMGIVSSVWQGVPNAKPVISAFVKIVGMDIMNKMGSAISAQKVVSPALMSPPVKNAYLASASMLINVSLALEIVARTVPVGSMPK
jgi:hypothetical protein